jgi:hypothetical protein
MKLHLKTYKNPVLRSVLVIRSGYQSSGKSLEAIAHAVAAEHIGVPVEDLIRINASGATVEFESLHGFSSLMAAMMFSYSYHNASSAFVSEEMLAALNDRFKSFSLKKEANLARKATSGDDAENVDEDYFF